MQGQPYSRQETIHFDSETIKVVCLASPETVKGLQWALDRLNFTGRKYKLFLGNLQTLGKQALPDIYLLVLDLGQPVPLESLKSISDSKGLAVFLQPTPQQLLQLNELPHWQSMAWDSSSYERLALRLDEVGQRFEALIRAHRIQESFKKLITDSRQQPELIEWLNAPENYVGTRRFIMDPSRAFFSVGGSESRADLKLPLDAEFNRAELGEFRLQNNHWGFRLFFDQSPIPVKGNRDALKVGDQIEINRHLLQFKRSSIGDECLKLARRFQLINDSDLLESESNATSGDKTLADHCRSLLIAGVTGELRVNAGSKSGSIFFHEGVLYHAITGSVNGMKALTRIFSWPKPQSKINLKKIASPDRAHFRLTLKDFARLYENWNAKWMQVSPQYPPLGLRLRTIPERFLRRESFSIAESKVLFALNEYALVRDIFNFCNDMLDVDVVQTLIHLRKEGLIEPLKA